MKIFIRYFLVSIFVISAHIAAQSVENLGNMDEDFLNSLPDEVREDVLSEINNNSKINKPKNIREFLRSLIRKSWYYLIYRVIESRDYPECIDVDIVIKVKKG